MLKLLDHDWLVNGFNPLSGDTHLSKTKQDIGGFDIETGKSQAIAEVT